MPPSRLDVALGAVAAVLLAVGAVVSPLAAAAIAVVVGALIAAGARRSAAVALCILMALALVGVRVDASHRPYHVGDAQRR